MLTLKENRKRLMREIIDLSVAKNWGDAKREWDYLYIVDNLDMDNCLCGVEIRYLHYIQNRLNKKITFVGSKCIEQFGNEFLTGSSGICERLARKMRLTEAQVLLCRERDYLDDYQYEFYLDCRLKRVLTENQERLFNKIHSKIEFAIRNRKNCTNIKQSN